MKQRRGCTSVRLHRYVFTLHTSKPQQHMKKLFIAGLLALLWAVAAVSARAQAKYGLVSYDSLLHQMPEYVEVQRKMAGLKQKYEAEAHYNEESFKRMFTEFLEGQKDFPQNIMLKRQRDLQEAMEKGLHFRHAADSLLTAAERDLCRPVLDILHTALDAVGKERGYELIINTDVPSFPFVSPALCEDAMPFVRAKLRRVQPLEPRPATPVRPLDAPEP